MTAEPPKIENTPGLKWKARCFICGRVAASLDKEPPWRCHECFNAVAANEADGEP